MPEYTYDPVDAPAIEEPIDIKSLVSLNESEINQQIATAKRYPRSIKKFRDEALQLATLDEQTAAECIYALPRDGKVIEGPSARLAEIIDYSWTNTRSLSRIVSEDGEFVTSQGVHFDLERNRAVSCEVKRRITNKHGKRYSADMITTTANAAGSIAYRNCVFRGVPKALWKPIYEACRQTVAGDFKTLSNRRENALQAFVIYGVTPDMIYKLLGVAGKEDIGLEHLVILRGTLTALKDGDTTVEEVFGNIEPIKRSAATGAATDQTLKDISKKYADNGAPQNPPVASADQAQESAQSSGQEAPSQASRKRAKQPSTPSQDASEIARRAQEKLDERKQEPYADQPSGQALFNQNEGA